MNKLDCGAALMCLAMTASSGCDNGPVPCKDPGAVRVEEGYCDCPDGWDYVDHSCVPPSDIGTGAPHDRDGAADSGPDGEVRDAARRDASEDSPNSELIDAAGFPGAEAPQVPGIDNGTDAAPQVPSAENGADAASLDGTVEQGSAPEDGGSTVCAVLVEICDGKDQDCDGVADNGLKNACGGPCGHVVPPEDCATAEDDNCDGRVNEGCEPPPPSCIPRAEVCDGKDQDCDGVPDNGVKNACGTCGAVPTETCNGKDDDCDGDIDEAVKNACGTCGAVPTEVCDGKDNDCDGMTDEGVKNACGTCGAVPTEVCDGVDNDCDGIIDEGVKNACGTCGAVPAEVCDGVDNNCDGAVDEGTFTHCGGSCTGSEPAPGTSCIPFPECSVPGRGTTVCQSGHSFCQPGSEPEDLYFCP